MKRARTEPRSGSALTVRNPVYQFHEAATKLHIKDLFYAVSAHAHRAPAHQTGVSVSSIHWFSTPCRHTRVTASEVLPDAYRAIALSVSIAKNKPPKVHPNNRAACRSCRSLIS
jgi:hypothetical protein